MTEPATRTAITYAIILSPFVSFLLNFIEGITGFEPVTDRDLKSPALTN